MVSLGQLIAYGSVDCLGDKLRLPESSTAKIFAQEPTFPLCFELSTTVSRDERLYAMEKGLPMPARRTIYAGVLEFNATEDCCLMPLWMMETLAIKDGRQLNVSNITIPKGNYVKLQPHSLLSNQRTKQQLEAALRNFTTLTQGTTINIPDMNDLKLSVLEVKAVGNASIAHLAQPAINIFDADLTVEFEAPPASALENIASEMISTNISNAMSDTSVQSDGKQYTQFTTRDLMVHAHEYEHIDCIKDSIPLGSYKFYRLQLHEMLVGVMEDMDDTFIKTIDSLPSITKSTSSGNRLGKALENEPKNEDIKSLTSHMFPSSYAVDTTTADMVVDENEEINFNFNVDAKVDRGIKIIEINCKPIGKNLDVDLYTSFEHFRPGLEVDNYEFHCIETGAAVIVVDLADLCDMINDKRNNQRDEMGAGYKGPVGDILEKDITYLYIGVHAFDNPFLNIGAKYRAKKMLDSENKEEDDVKMVENEFEIINGVNVVPFTLSVQNIKHEKNSNEKKIGKICRASSMAIHHPIFRSSSNVNLLTGKPKKACESSKDPNKKLCKNCRRFVGINTYERHLIHCLKKYYYCIECRLVVDKSQFGGTALQKHKQTFHCDLQCVICSTIISGGKKKLLHHQRYKCMKRLLLCMFCHLNFPFDEFALHEQMCGSRTEKCEICQEYIALSLIHEHSLAVHGAKYEEPVAVARQQTMNPMDDVHIVEDTVVNESLYTSSHPHPLEAKMYGKSSESKPVENVLVVDDEEIANIPMIVRARSIFNMNLHNDDNDLVDDNNNNNSIVVSAVANVSVNVVNASGGGGTWVCPFCTFENENGAVCGVCEFPPDVQQFV